MTTEIYTDRDMDRRFLPEVWSWFGIGCIIITMRYIVRFRTVGFWAFQGDDYIMALAFVLYMMDAILVTLIFVYGANIDVPPEYVDSLTDGQVSKLEVGSKAQLAAWFTYTAMIWCMKFCMLFFYKRLTFGTMRHRTVNWLMWVCGLSYIAVFLTLCLACRPFWHNWQVRPLPSSDCTFKPQNFWVTAVLNIITDALILIIPVPLLWKLKVSVRRKLAIAALLSSGVFVIVAAIVRAVLTLSGTSSTTNINTWGVRETIVGFITVNIPILRPIASRSFWRGGVYSPSLTLSGAESSDSRRRSNMTPALATIGSWRTRRVGGGTGGGTGVGDDTVNNSTFELRAHSSSSGSSPTSPTKDNTAIVRCGWPQARSTTSAVATAEAVTAVAAAPRESEEHIIGETMPRVPRPVARGVTMTRSFRVQREGETDEADRSREGSQDGDNEGSQDKSHDGSHGDSHDDGHNGDHDEMNSLEEWGERRWGVEEV